MFSSSHLTVIHFVRSFLLSIFIFHSFYPTFFDAKLQAIWSTLCQFWLVQHDSFEPLVASVAFAAWILFFRFLDEHVRAAWPYRLDASLKAKPVVWTSFKGNHLLSALSAYLLPFIVFDWIYPRRHLSDMLEAPTFVRLSLEIVACLFVYDFLFFWIHLAFHKIKWLKEYHTRHHDQNVMRAAETLRLSFVDGTLQVICSISSLHIVGAHPMSRMFFNITITYLLAEIHSGYDLPFQSHNIVPFGILGGAPRHEVHHRKHQGYHQFFTYLDSFF